MDHRARHIYLVPDSPSPSSAVTVATGGSDNADGAGAASRDQVAPLTNVALRISRRNGVDTFDAHRTQNPFRAVPTLDQPALDAPATGSEQADASSQDRSRHPVDLHPLARRSLERKYRKWFLWWTPDDLRLGRRQPSRSAQRIRADGSRGTAVPSERLLDRVAGLPMAQDVTSLLGLRIGSTKVW